MSVLHARVSELAEQVRGVSYGKQDASDAPQAGYLPILRAGNITDDGLVFDDLVFVPKERISEKQKIRRHDVVIAASSGSLEVVGKAAPALRNYDGGFGAFCKVLRPNKKVHPNYFAHFFKTRYYRQRVSALAAGANINNLRNEHLDDFEIPLPPLAKQQRIADVLDKAEALRAKRRAALAQLDTLTQSIFLDMFGDPVSNPKGWPEKAIGEIGQVITGSTPSREITDYYGSAIEWIKSDNINTPSHYLTRAVEGLSETGKAVGRIAPRGSILVTCIAGSPECIGNAAIADREVAFNQQINALVPRDSDTRFLYAQLLVAKRLIQAVSTASMKGMVSKSRFEGVRLILPPLQLQREFSKRFEAVEKLKQSQRGSLTALDALFSSLQHRAFRGEL